MLNTNTISYLLTVVFCCCLLPVKADTKNSQIKPDNVEANKVLENWNFLLVERKWKNDPALEKKVSFTVEREPFGEFLDRLSKLSGTRFMLPAASPFKSKKITASVKEMPVTEVVRSINRLYGLTWDENPDGGYIAVELPLNGIEQEIWKFGDLRNWNSPEQSMSGPNRKALAQSLLPHLIPELINNKTGQSISTVPLELQKQVRETISYSAALDLVNSHSKALLPHIADMKISSSKKLKNVKPDTDLEAEYEKIPWSVNIIDSQGRVIAPIGQFGIMKAMDKKPFVDEKMAAF
jgi:hypothetical protein